MFAPKQTDRAKLASLSCTTLSADSVGTGSTAAVVRGSTNFAAMLPCDTCRVAKVASGEGP